MSGGRPIVQCEEVSSHAPHHHLVNTPLFGSQPVYASCDGVLPTSPQDPNPTRTNIPVGKLPSSVIPSVEAMAARVRSVVGVGASLRSFPIQVSPGAATILHCGKPRDVDYIVDMLLPEVRAKMLRDAEHYGPDNHKELGLRGQFADIWRKINPLRRILWEGKESVRESPREILLDLVGHSLLTICMIDHMAAEAEEQS